MFFTSFMTLVLLCLKGSLIFFFFCVRYSPRCYCIRRYFVVFFQVVHVLFCCCFFVLFFSARHPYTPRCGLTPSLGQASAGPSSPSIRDHFRTEELCNQAISYLEFLFVDTRQNFSSLQLQWIDNQYKTRLLLCLHSKIVL